MNRIILSAAVNAGKAMYRHGRKAFYSLCVLAASATMLYARAGGSGGGHSSSHSSGSHSSGSYHSSGSSFGSSSSGSGIHSGGSVGGFGFFFVIIVIGLAGFFIYYKFFYKPSATGFKSFPDVEPKDFNSLDGAAEFIAANPDFNEDEFLGKAEKAFTDIQTAWAAGDIGPVRRFLSDGVYQRFSTQIAMMGLLKQKDVITDITVEEIFVDCIERDGLFDILHVSITGGMSDEFVCETNHDLDSPGGYETFTEYWSFLRKRGKGGKDLYFSQNCPSCSAPLPPDMGDTGNCPYCKSFVNSGEYDWVLSEITQVDDYGMDSYRSSKTSNLDKQAEKLASDDEGFSVQLLEDKISNGYLQIQTAIAFKDPAKMRRFVGDKAYNKVVASFPKSQIVFNRLYLNDVSVIAVKEEDGKNVIHAAVKSSYQRAVIEGGKAHLLDSAVMTKKEIIVVEREKAAGASKGSVYAHQCPSCGAPLSDSLDVNCGYCGAVLNSSKNEWIISDILEAAEYRSDVKSQSFAFSSDPDLEDSLYTARDFAYNNALVIFAADGVFADQEKGMAYDLAKKWNYKEDYVDQMIQAASSGRLSIRMPMGRDKSRKIYEMMMKAAAADGSIGPEEQAILDQVKKEYLDK